MLATKFRIQGTSDVFGQITVNIQLNGYTGSIIDLDAVGRDWIKLKIGDNSSEMSSPILAGKLTFSFYVNEDFETTEIGKSDVYTYYVEVLDDSLDQIWAGWAMPEEYTEAYHNTPYVATVVASDGLQELKNVNYPLQDGKATLFTHLQNCLITTFVNNNIFESVNIYSNGMNSTASDSPFKQAQVTYNSFRSISETPKAYEVLSSLLVPFFARIYQYRGWRIEAILEKRSSYVVREYDVTGAFVGQSTFNPLVKFDTDYSTFKAFIQKSGQLSIRPALNNAEVYFNTVEPVEPTTTGGFQNADDWNSTTDLKDWTAVAGVGANPITIEQVPANFDGNEFAVKIPGRKTTLEQTDYIESDPVNIASADYESINVDFAHLANYPSIVLFGTKPILYFEVIFTETSSGDVYNWSGSEWVLIPLGQARRRLRIDFNDRFKWRRYSAVIDRVPSTGNIKFRFYKLIKSGSEGVTELRLTAWKTNLITQQTTNAALLLEAGTTNVFTQYKGPSFPHIISDGTVLNASGVMDVANTLTATWARRGVTESLNIRRLFLTQWLSFNSRPTEILSGVIHQKGEVITPMSVVKDKDAVSSTRYVMQSYEMSLGTGIGSASYREIVMEDANINAFQEFLDSIRLGDFFATTVNYNIFIGGAPGLSPGANPGQIDLNFSLNGDVRGGLNQAEITPAAIQNKARLDLTGLTADDIVLGAVKDSPDQENMTNLRLSDIKPLVSTPVTIGSPANGLSISGTQVLTIGLASTSATGALSSTDWNTFNNKLNLTSPITGYTVGANTALAATDTILQAFGKVQGQINARISGTIASGQVAFGTGVNTVGGNSGLTYGVFLIQDTISDTRYIQRINGVNTGQIQTTSTFFNISSITEIPIIFSTNSAIRWRILSGGNLEGNGPRTIQTSTGNLTLATAGGNGNIFLTPNGTGLVGIATTSPTNTLDVNGTTRIRTINNLGSAATSVLVPSATGVLSLRTLAELSADIGAGSKWTDGTSGSIYRLSGVYVNSSTTSPTNATFLVRSLATGNHLPFSIYNNAGTTPLIECNDNGVFSVIGTAETGGRATFTIRNNNTSTSSVGFRMLDSSGVAYLGYSKNIFDCATTRFQISGNAGVAGSQGVVKVTNNSSDVSSRIMELYQGVNGRLFVLGDRFLWQLPYFAIGDPSSQLTNGVTIKGGVSTSTNIFRIDNSSNTSLFTLNGLGDITFVDGSDWSLGTITGTKIGTATTQKLAFWNATPIVQPTTAVASGTLVSNAGTTITSTDTIDGYTLQQVVRALRNTGLLA